MILSLQTKNDHLILKILTDIMMDNAKDFYKEFEAISKENLKIQYISFDFGKVNFMDSSGIGSLIKSAATVKAFGTIVNVFNLNKSLFSVFKLSGLDNIITMYTNDEFFQKFPELK